MRLFAIAVLTTVAIGPSARAGPPSEVLEVAGIGGVSIYAPRKAPTEVVLFISGDGGWNLGVVAMAERLRDLGALVAGVDIRSFLLALGKSADCAYPAGSLEELSRVVQLHHRLPEYKTPILVGYSSGATLVYAAMAQAPAETFAGTISLGFCPDIEIVRPLCATRNLKATKKAKGLGYDLEPAGRLETPWMVLHGEVDQVCEPARTRAFVASVPSARLFSLPKVGHGFGVTRNWDAAFVDAYRTISTRRAAVDSLGTAPEVRDLALVEVAPGSTGHISDAMAVILTGDGGWAELDKGVASALAANGVPSVGWSSLKYYWTPRTPDEAAADLARIIKHYTSAWKKTRVILVGYSFGADVLPFLVNRLPTEVRAQIASAALLGLSDTALFEFRVAGWLGGGGDPSHPTAPEVERLSVPVSCVFGAGEDSACRRLRGPNVALVEVGCGHHFSGDYDRLVDVILGTPR